MSMVSSGNSLIRTSPYMAVAPCSVVASLTNENLNCSTESESLEKLSYLKLFTKIQTIMPSGDNALGDSSSHVDVA